MPTSEHQCLAKFFCLKISSFALPTLNDLTLNVVIQEKCKHQGAWVYFIKLNKTLEVACRPNLLPSLNLTIET